MFIIFLWMETILPFIHSDGSEPVARAWLNIIFKGLQMAWLHVFKMQILTLSCLWALWWSRSWIIFPISFAENVTGDNRLSVRKLQLVGSLLWLAKREHCLEKKELEISAFSLKSVIKHFSWYKEGIGGIF